MRGGRGVPGASRSDACAASARTLCTRCRAADLLADLDLVALATVADVVPLTGLNRAYVRKGLAVMKSREKRGFARAVRRGGLNQAPTTYHLGYILGPRINAGGRIGDAALGARLLTTEDETDAQKIAVLLDKLNKERKAIETQMLEEAFAHADRRLSETPICPSSWSDRRHGTRASSGSSRAGSWNGSGGRVASSRGRRRRFGLADGHWIAALGRRCRHRCGGAGCGRAGAATERAAVTRWLRADCGAGASDFRWKRTSRVSLRCGFSGACARGTRCGRALVPSGVTDGLMDLIERAGPYGQGNPQPRFAFPSVRVKFAKQVGEAHLRCVLEAADGSRLEGVALPRHRATARGFAAEYRGMPVHIAGSLKRDTWGGREKIELTIEDAADPRRQG